MDKDDRFREVYLKYRQKISEISQRYSKTSSIPASDFDSELSEEVWRACNTYDPTRGCSLDTWVNTRFRQRAIDHLRSSKNASFYRRRSFLRLDTTSDMFDEESNSSAYSVADVETVEEIVLDKKKEVDQRQLIDFLLDRANDPVTTRIVTMFRESDCSLSITALAKALGLHHEVVRRKLRSLSRHYDANRFGDYKDYLAV